MTTRLPPQWDEPARTEAAMPIIAREIRSYLHNRRHSATGAGPLLLIAAAAGIEAAGYGGTEPLPDYPELNPQSACVPSAPAPDEAVAATPKPTTASLIIGIDHAQHRDLHSEALMQGDKVIGWREGQTPSFSPSFLSHVKQNGGLADCATLCGVSLDWFTRKLDVLLTAPYSFPAPVTETGQRRWKLADVRTWADTPTATFTLTRARKAHRKTLETKA